MVNKKELLVDGGSTMSGGTKLCRATNGGDKPKSSSFNKSKPITKFVFVTSPIIWMS